VQQNQVTKMNYELVLKIIYSFYEVAKKDYLIGYQFRSIQNFDEHIPRIADFWNLQVNGEVENRTNLPFNLINTHKPLKLKKAEIGRWMVIFENNLKTYVQSNQIGQADADTFMRKVHHMRDKLQGILFA
jgi:hemoglobin